MAASWAGRTRPVPADRRPVHRRRADKTLIERWIAIGRQWAAAAAATLHAGLLRASTDPLVRYGSPADSGLREG